MASTPRRALNSADVQILRDLARQVKRISQDPVMEERRRLWLKHNSLRGERPMILAETGGVLDELVPVSVLECTQDWARGLERGLRNTIFTYEHVKDDSVVEPIITWNWHLQISDYGVQSKRQTTSNEGKLASYRWEPPVKDLRTDFAKLRPRTFSINHESSLEWKASLAEIFGGILDVRQRGGFWWTMGMTWTAIDLVGLENLMLFMYDNPEGLHRLMAFLRDDHLALLDFVEKEQILSLNNRNDYVGSGSLGYTLELPRPRKRANDPVIIKDLWGLSESQETVGVSPEMFAEFIFPYQLPVIERFGLSYYGCCEPVHSRWESIRKIQNLRKVSVSPWADQEFLGEALAGKYVFCRKPNPAMISSERFDEQEIRADLRRTVRAADGCNFEIVMKDVHTVANQPDRLGKWVEMARDVSTS
ncbi:MAG TPA: hypothetical protein VM223_02035 [Planctomycetota bacterium]|nr:hypothetical protein [Planctomycetota bacterium]